MRILCKTILVAGRAAANIDIVALSDTSGQSTRTGKDTSSIVCKAGAVNVKTSKNLGDGLVETKDNLDVTVRVL